MDEEKMEEVKIRCPKCSHEQTGGGECASCGLIFVRYERHRQRREERKAASGSSRDASGLGVKILAAVVLVGLTAGLTFYLVRPAGQEKTPQSAVAPAAQPIQQQAQATPPKSPQNVAPTPSGPALRQAGGSSITEARDATVSIETPWGTGSGFFVNKHYIVTNRHVIEVDQEKLQQGDKVFTIGSPVGLRHTVTSGIFSGYRKRENDGSMFLQTDAAINPDNSGGPLIDERGYVLGVNTMILQDTEGIGFAIPIEAVFEEFASALP